MDCSNAENVALHNWSFKLRLEPHEGENGNLKKSVSTIREVSYAKFGSLPGVLYYV